MVSSWSQRLLRKDKSVPINGYKFVRYSIFSHVERDNLLHRRSERSSGSVNEPNEVLFTVSKSRDIGISQDIVIRSNSVPIRFLSSNFNSDSACRHCKFPAWARESETWQKGDPGDPFSKDFRFPKTRHSGFEGVRNFSIRSSSNVANRGKPTLAERRLSPPGIKNNSPDVHSPGRIKNVSSLGSKSDLWDSYDPKAIADYYRWRPLSVFLRAASVTSEIVMLRLWRYFEPDIAKRAVKLRQSLIRLGPFYIKIGQALATRPDVLPGIYCQELAKLQDQIPPFPTSLALTFLEAELGVPPSEVFAEISPEPVAAASLGQVYRARLQSGENVAVKVQRPGLVSRLALDAHLLRIIAARLQHYFKANSDLVALVDELVGRLFEEVDYIREGNNAERFAALYAVDPNLPGPPGVGGQNAMAERVGGGIKVPAIFWKSTSRRVLTMEWIDSIKLTDHKAIEEAKLDVQHLVDLGVMCSLRQLLEEGFFHADPHPGNVVATKHGQLVYFDFGMMSEMRREYRIGLIRTLVHFVNRDAAGLAKDFDLLGFLPPAAPLDDITEALRETFAAQGSRASMDFQSIMLQLSSVMREFGFRLPVEFAMVIRALGSLEGTATTLDPSFKVVASAYPFIVGRLLVEAGPEMRAILRELLIRPDGSIRWNRFERLVLAVADQARPNSLERGKEKQEIPRVDTLTGVGLRGAFNRRAVVAAAADLLDFILSDNGVLVRVGIVRDVVHAADEVIRESLYKRVRYSPEEVHENKVEGLRSGERGYVQDDSHAGANGSDSTEEVDKSGEEFHRAATMASSRSTLSSKSEGGSLTLGGVAEREEGTVRGVIHVGEKSNGKTEFAGEKRTSERTEDVETTEIVTDFSQKEGNTRSSDKPSKEDTASDRLASGLRAAGAAMGNAPELWVPLLVRTATRKEAQDMGGAMLHGVSECYTKATAEASWLALSSWLRKVNR